MQILRVVIVVRNVTVLGSLELSLEGEVEAHNWGSGMEMQANDSRHI